MDWSVLILPCFGSGVSLSFNSFLPFEGGKGGEGVPLFREPQSEAGRVNTDGFAVPHCISFVFLATLGTRKYSPLADSLDCSRTRRKCAEKREEVVRE